MARLIAGTSILHLALCYAYLYFLYLGFGGRIVTLFSATDILSVGLGKILPFYLSFLPSMIFNHLWMIDEPFKVIDRQEFSLHEKVANSKLSWLFKSLIFIAPISQVILYLFGKPILLVGLLFPVVLLVSWLTVKIFLENNISDKYRLPVILGFIGLLLISANAYSEGFAARHRDYASFSDSPMVCGKENKAIFSVGDLFITVRPNGIREAISHGCELKLTFEKRDVTVPILPF